MVEYAWCVIGLFASFHVGKKGRYILLQYIICKAYPHSRGSLTLLYLLFSSCLQPDNTYVCAEEEETGRGDKERLKTHYRFHSVWP